MRRETTVLAILAAMIWAGTGNAAVESKTEVYSDPDAYEIYALLLKSTNKTSFVIESETSTFAGEKDAGVSGEANFRKLWGAALDNFVAQNQTTKTLTQHIPIEVPYELVSKERLEQVLKSPGQWKAFYEQFPSSDGYVWFSAVGFDPPKKRAIATMNHACGILCAGGRAHFFEKHDGSWHEVHPIANIQVWMS
jgi:hypothetical protein